MTQPSSLGISMPRPGICRLTLDRPPANALDTPLMRALAAKLGALAQEPRPPVVLLDAAGPRFFSAGGDIREFETIGPEAAAARIGDFHRMLCALEAYSAPIVAAVQGYAVGGGLELVLFADLVIAAPEARFGFPEINHGLLPAIKGMRRAGEIMGNRRAAQLLFGGELIAAETGFELGIVNRIVAKEALAETALAEAERLAEKPPAILAAMKRALYQCWGLSDPDIETQTRIEMHRLALDPEAAAARSRFLTRREG